MKKQLFLITLFAIGSNYNFTSDEDLSQTEKVDIFLNTVYPALSAIQKTVKPYEDLDSREALETFNSLYPEYLAIITDTVEALYPKNKYIVPEIVKTMQLENIDNDLMQSPFSTRIVTFIELEQILLNDIANEKNEIEKYKHNYALQYFPELTEYLYEELFYSLHDR